MANNNDDHFNGAIHSSIELFKKMLCLTGAADDIERVEIEMLDEEKMRCNILDCLVALRRVQRYKKDLAMSRKLLGMKFTEMSRKNVQYESAKSRIFASAILMILDEQRPIESFPLTLLLAPFPDTEKMIDGRTNAFCLSSWE
jgi:hypothetical protein